MSSIHFKDIVSNRNCYNQGYKLTTLDKGSIRVNTI